MKTWHKIYCSWLLAVPLWHWITMCVTGLGPCLYYVHSEDRQLPPIVIRLYNSSIFIGKMAATPENMPLLKSQYKMSRIASLLLFCSCITIFYQPVSHILLLCFWLLIHEYTNIMASSSAMVLSQLECWDYVGWGSVNNTLKWLQPSSAINVLSSMTHNNNITWCGK